METIAVDHVQFAVRDVAACARYLSRQGYELQFEAADFNRGARSYYRDLQKDMAYLKRGASRIEVITGAGDEGDARYIPVLDGLGPADHVPALDMGEFRAFRHEALSGVCARRSRRAPTLDGVILRASRPDESCDFWRSLGFELKAQDERWYTLAFPHSMLSMPLTVFVARTPSQHSAPARADDLGCSSIALITRDLAADRAALSHSGHALSESTSLRINQRSLAICFASGPSGELVELIEIGRTECCKDGCQTFSASVP